MDFLREPFSYFLFLLTLAPSDGYRRHLSQGKASHSLLQRRFAPRKAVRLLPVIRGRLFNVSHFLILGFNLYKKL